MNKPLEELQKEYEESAARLEQEKRKLRRLENRKVYLESGSRKQRNHRLIRGYGFQGWILRIRANAALLGRRQFKIKEIPAIKKARDGIRTRGS